MAAQKHAKREWSKEALAELAENARTPFTPGQAVMVITVTLYYIGLVVKVTEDEFILANMGIITEIDNMTQTLAGKKELSVEMCPDDGLGVIARGSIIAAFPYEHNLPVPKV